jgi:hypothetical protein
LAVADESVEDPFEPCSEHQAVTGLGVRGVGVDDDLGEEWVLASFHHRHHGELRASVHWASPPSRRIQGKVAARP